jgi:hypothetical protein
MDRRMTTQNPMTKTSEYKALSAEARFDLDVMLREYPETLDAKTLRDSLEDGEYLASAGLTADVVEELHGFAKSLLAEVTIYGEHEKEGICLFTGVPPLGKTLDLRLTESGMHADLEDAILTDLGMDSEPEDWSEEDVERYEDQKSITCERLMAMDSWYEDNYVWIDAE